jgi:hypothetical protein
MDVKAFATLVKEGDHIRGSSVTSNYRFQESTVTSDNHVRVTIYACVDVKQVRLLNSSNKDVTPSGPDVVPLVLGFISRDPGSKTLVLDGSDGWTGDDFC